jgi:hypothetical protein
MTHRNLVQRRRRGAPAKAFRSDPDRYLLAVATAFGGMGTSRRGALEIAVAAVQGLPVGPNLKPGWGRGINLLDAEYELRRPASAATIAGRAEGLRQKIKKALDDPDAVKWLAAMSTAWLIALEWPPHPAAQRLMLDLAGAVGEGQFAAKVLIRLLLLPKKHIFPGKTSKSARRITGR